MQIRDASLQPLGYEQLTSAGAALTPTVPSGARYILIKVETKAFRWRDDGTNPTGTVGTPIDVGDEFFYTGKPGAIRLIEDGATSTGKLNLTYYR